MFAAHAAAEAGWDFAILSKSRKSFMRGAQYLHMPIPGLSGEPFKIDYRLDGPIDGYRDKVYGDMSDVHVSPESLVGVADAWDIREAYDAAWERYEGRIVEWDAAGAWTLEEVTLGLGFDLVVSTIPAKLLCSNPAHEFRSQFVWATDYVKPVGVFDRPQVDNLVVCSGYDDDWWYRQSRIKGWENTEFPDDKKPGGKSWHVEKPVDTDCDCKPDVLRLGRYGAWRKGVLSHEAYYDLATILAEKEESVANAR